jgi:hypothetical protein
MCAVCSQSVRERDWTISLLKEVVHGQHKGDIYATAAQVGGAGIRQC